MSEYNMRVRFYAERYRYLLGYDGGTGKSYLYSILSGYRQLNKNRILLFTKSEYYREDDIIDEIEKFTGDIIMLDRFDLYYTDDIINAINNKDNCIILIDSKDTAVANKLKARLAYINMTERIIEVHEL